MKLTDWKDIEEKMIEWRRDLHQIPELGNELPQTSAYVQSVLTELGVPFHTLMSGNAVVGLITGSGDETSKTIALRADMDALPVYEDTGHPWASKNGCMHACGHDGHTAMLLGAAAWLQANRDVFSGAVKLLFQPGEESPGGAEPMILEGCLENPKVAAIFGIHEGQISEEIPFGHVGFKRGPMMAATDRLQIEVIGHGGHGAYPQLTVDPITLSAEIVMGLQSIISREKSANDPAVLSITHIEGGASFNVIPDSVLLEGTVRTFNPETRVWLRDRIRTVAEGTAKLRGGEAKVEHLFRYPALINDDGMLSLARGAAEKVVGDARITDMVEPSMGGEDFAFFTEKVPGCYAFMTNSAPIDGKVYPHHTSKFDVDESMFLTGAQLHVQVALDFLNA